MPLISHGQQLEIVVCFFSQVNKRLFSWSHRIFRSTSTVTCTFSRSNDDDAASSSSPPPLRHVHPRLREQHIDRLHPRGTSLEYASHSLDLDDASAMAALVVGIPIVFVARSESLAVHHRASVRSVWISCKRSPPVTSRFARSRFRSKVRTRAADFPSPSLAGSFRHQRSFAYLSADADKTIGARERARRLRNPSRISHRQ